MKSISTGGLPPERYGAQKAGFGSSGTISIMSSTRATGLGGGARGGSGDSARCPMKRKGGNDISDSGAGMRKAGGISTCGMRKWVAGTTGWAEVIAGGGSKSCVLVNTTLAAGERIGELRCWPFSEPEAMSSVFLPSG
jgi:hypothetical protein